MERNERMAGGVRYAHPVFAVVRADGRHFRWLAERIGYSHSHVRNVACGQFPATPKFRAACAALLGLPERDLFHSTDSSASTPGDTDGSDNGAGTAVGAPPYRIEEEAPISQIA